MQSQPDALVRLEYVRKVFRARSAETHALSDISLDVRRGEYVAISGPSGCGKSTLLSILGLLDVPGAPSTSWMGASSGRNNARDPRKA